MRFALISLLSLSALALAARAPEPAPQGNVAPTCSSPNECRSFCTAPCTNPFCGLSAFRSFLTR
ncbi:hypothetical protein CPLU01_10903 [Colletotrichum plurivorum]|uniref:Uncharacterized protein n=1 Tax=Colletotrichum plurivorum TaxID=2175906 RepID=A0A8H6K4S4_9PEZI|nr:hypothetical protein CPLU01_10903 [Colletotrichum plurivorum]